MNQRSNRDLLEGVDGRKDGLGSDVLEFFAQSVGTDLFHVLDQFIETHTVVVVGIDVLNTFISIQKAKRFKFGGKKIAWPSLK